MTENTEQPRAVPLILNIEAATDVCSVCLSRGMEVLAKHTSIEQNEHSRIITILIQQCVADAGLSLEDLDAVAVSEGPGSYTSLRVGFSTAKGICFALDKPLIIVSTLEALAKAAYQAEQDPNALYCPMIDARRMEVYTALFNADGNHVMPPQAMIIDQTAFDEYFSAGRRIFFCGNGAEKCKAVINSSMASFSSVKNCDSGQLISSAMIAFLNKNFTDIIHASPTYLKSPNITFSSKKPS